MHKSKRPTSGLVNRDSFFSDKMAHAKVNPAKENFCLFEQDLSMTKRPVQEAMHVNKCACNIFVIP